MKHSRLGGSVADRWIHCPGSIQFIEQMDLPKTTSPAAEEGTIAHGYAEKCLTDNVNASTLNLDDLDMTEGIQVYLDYIRGLKPTRLNIEHRIDLDDLGLGLEMFGTCDCVAYKDNTAYIIDFKYGRKGVEVEWNPQMLYYALGVLLENMRNGYHITRLEMVIVQPRFSHENGKVRSFALSDKQVSNWGYSVLYHAAEATQGESPDIKAGRWCKWCPVRGVCAEASKHSTLALRAKPGNTPKNPNQLTPIEIGIALQWQPVIKSWLEDLENYAQQLMLNGTEIAGQKLVRKKTNRVWQDEKSIGIELQKYLNDKAFKSKVITPTQALKLLKAMKGVNKKALEDFEKRHVLKPEGAIVMASEGDSRKAVAIDSPAEKATKFFK